MKKLFALLIAFCGLLSLTGCSKTEIESFSFDKVDQAPYALNWESFTFKSLKGNAPLVVERLEGIDQGISIATSKYKGKFLAVALYKKDCALCQDQAPYFDKLAKELPSSIYDIDFAVIFLDIFDDSNENEVKWIKDLSHLDAYTNVASVCDGGACRQAFTPYLSQAPLEGNIYIINKQAVRLSKPITTWDPSLPVEQSYDNVKKEIASILGLGELYFNPQVEDFEEEGIGVTM